MGVSKNLKLGFLWLWGPITSCSDLWLQWSLNQSYSPRFKLSNGMLHVACMWGNQGDSPLLVITSQIANLTPILSFGHNLCFRCPNGSCEPILNIDVSIAFKWYKKLFNLMGFDPCNGPLKIRESIGTLTPKMGIHLGVRRFIHSHFFALPGARCVTSGLHSWPATLQALVLVVSPRLGLQQNGCGEKCVTKVSWNWGHKTWVMS
jgi:hypothetical protein